MTSLMCLAVAIYMEARSEPTIGQYAIAQVVVNRVEDERYPDTVCAVVFEPNQFSFTHDGLPDRLPKEPTEASLSSLVVAEDILEGVSYPTSATHYHTASVYPGWRHDFDFDQQIGVHKFYVNNTPYR